MKFFRQLFTQNIGLKFVSLLLAFAFWRIITSEDIAEVGYIIPLELRNIPKEVEVVGDVINSVSVRTRASSKLIKRLSSADMYIFIDLAHAALGEHTYPLNSANVQAPIGVEVVRVIPTHVKLRLERTIHKLLPVKVRWRGSFPDSKGDPELVPAPAEIEVEGPESRVNDLKQVSTDAIDLSRVTPNQKVSVNLSVDDPTVRLSQEKVDVQINVSSKNVPAGKGPSSL
ncbi:MAG: YbbR-like domain-containing protein [Terriglobia bacterium]